MKITDLIIGDYVRNKRTNEIVWVCEIDGDRKVINNEPDGYNSERNIDFDDIEPIPLTSEILEKNFFDVSDKEVKRYYFEEDGQCYHFSLRQMYDKENKPKGYSFYAFNVLTIIDYVHELQHALRLVGLNDLADNFKI